MTTFTTSDREEAEKELKFTPEELGKALEKLIHNYTIVDEPIPFFGWWNDGK
jgi:hypothetical protein